MLSVLLYSNCRWFACNNRTSTLHASKEHHVSFGLARGLLPDYQLTMKIKNKSLGIVLLEGKKESGKNSRHKWDDKSKLGNMMKLALDGLLSCSPCHPIKAFGILVDGTCNMLLLAQMDR